ncbi:hypothetical protein [Micromonospora sp. SH-82]|uniref:hypothetical protein n=1 Tax=Micromonospora sp. SH-82 TaxID=3132938 RepID=UPI003EC07FAD
MVSASATAPRRPAWLRLRQHSRQSTRATAPTAAGRVLSSPSRARSCWLRSPASAMARCRSSRLPKRTARPPVIGRQTTARAAAAPVTTTAFSTVIRVRGEDDRRAAGSGRVLPTQYATTANRSTTCAVTQYRSRGRSGQGSRRSRIWSSGARPTQTVTNAQNVTDTGAKVADRVVR